MKGIDKNALDRQALREGYCYFTISDGKFYIDTADTNNTLHRYVLNAYHADGVASGQSLAYVGFSSTPILFLSYNNKNSWAIERDGTNNQLKSHYYNSDGGWVDESILLTSKNYATYIPKAGSGTAGLVSTGTQTFDGTKTFSAGTITLRGSTSSPYIGFGSTVFDKNVAFIYYNGPTKDATTGAYTYNSHVYIRIYGLTCTTGAAQAVRGSYYYTYYFPTTPTDITANASRYILYANSNSTVGSSTQPVYFSSQGATTCSTYAGGTKVTLNGSAKGASTASFYAPTGAGTSGYILKSNGSGAPTWLQTLPIANGGTGATTAKAAATSFLGALETATATPIDGTYYITQDVNGGSTYHRRPASSLYQYIKTKLDTAGINSIKISEAELGSSFATTFRTTTMGSTGGGAYINVCRSEANYTSAPAYGSGLAWGRQDTHGYLYVNYNGAQAYIGGGNADKLNWTKKIWLEGDSITGAVWNDYAEYRESDCKDFGRVLVENGDDTLSISTERLQSFAGISSDTWGFCQGETEKAKTPIAVAGRVLVYPYQDRNNYKPGDCVCAAPNGTVDIMTREEIIQYPDRIVGIVSCIPDYEEWGSGDREPAKVNGRIWIKVK